MALVMALCQRFNVDPWRLRDLPLRWLEGAVLLMEAERRALEREARRARHGR